MPTQLPARLPPESEPIGAAAWIAGTLAFALLVGMTLRSPIPPDVAAADVEPDAPHLVRIVMAHAAPIPLGR